MKNKLNISVVMAVYKNDKPEWLSLAIDSILDQTYKAEEVIVVIDGPVSSSLQSCLDSYGDKIEQIALPKNQGLWNALNTGIYKAKYELIARMDADDIAKRDRFRQQVTEFENDNELALVGGQLIEFTGTVDERGLRRKVPLSYEEIVRFAKYRSPFNHPTVMFRKKAIELVGGYHELYRTEDYDLWTRMIQAGMKMKNLPDSVLYYRVNSANFKRRATPVQHREALALQGRLYKFGQLSLLEYVFARIGRIFFYLLPGFLKYAIYKNALRSTDRGIS